MLFSARRAHRRFLVDITHKRFGCPHYRCLARSSVPYFVPAVMALSPSLPVTWVLLAVFNLLAASLFTIGTDDRPSVARCRDREDHGCAFAWVGITGSQWPDTHRAARRAGVRRRAGGPWPRIVRCRRNAGDDRRSKPARRVLAVAPPGYESSPYCRCLTTNRMKGD